MTTPKKLYTGKPLKEQPKPTPRVTNVNPHRGEYTVKDGEKKTIFYF